MAEQKKILVIDDQPDMLAILKMALEGDECGVTTVSVPEKIHALVKKHWDCIITDYAMPNLSGVGVCDIIRMYNSHVPIVVISAYLSPHVLNNLLDAGATVCFDKPFDVDELTKKVKDLMVAQDTIPGLESEKEEKEKQELEKETIIRAFSRANMEIKLAAKFLRTDPNSLQRKMKDLGIETKEEKKDR